MLRHSSKLKQGGMCLKRMKRAKERMPTLVRTRPKSSAVTNGDERGECCASSKGGNTVLVTRSYR